VAEAARVLAGGGLVILPTDTVYGVAADPRVPDAVARLYEAKGRERGKPIPLLAASAAEVARRAGVLNAVEKRLAERFWPGALTLVLRAGGGTEGFRVPDCGVTRAILAAAGGVLRVTSANRSGEPPGLTAAEAARALAGRVELVIDGGCAPGGEPSTVVQVERGSIRVLREGALRRAELERALGR
jgi:L-threonylcarbamoyladenylate synthase